MDQKRKNIVLLISLGVLLFASTALYFVRDENREQIDPGLFKLSDPKSINQITIEGPKEKIDLSFISNRWRVNGTFEADNNLIDVLFATMEQAIPKRNVAQRLRDSIANTVLQSGTKVSFMANSTKQKEFSVYGDASSGLTYFSDYEDNTPYVMVIPGYRVYVAGIFEQDVNAWRDKRIFNFNWRNFKELKAEFPNDPKQTFSVGMTGRYFSVLGEANIDTTTLNNYLDAVSLVKADVFYKKGESALADSLSGTNPIMIITVKDVADQPYSLKVFTIGKFELNVLAQWGDDFVWFDRRNILQLYKKRKDFVRGGSSNVR